MYTTDSGFHVKVAAKDNLAVSTVYLILVD